MVFYNVFPSSYYKRQISCPFVCLEFSVPLEIFFHSYGDVTITGEGLQILTYTRHLWPLWSESSLACQTYCDTHPFKWSCAKTSDTHAYWLALSKGAITTCACFNDLGLSRLGFEHSTFRMQSECSF